VTPPSLLGRKVFWSVVVLLVPVLRQGPTPKRVERLCATFAVSVRTLRRWMRWWREALCGPGEPTERVLAVLGFVAPISTGAGLLGRAS
jgi:hypothetical protein